MFLVIFIQHIRHLNHKIQNQFLHHYVTQLKVVLFNRRAVLKSESSNKGVFFNNISSKLTNAYLIPNLKTQKSLNIDIYCLNRSTNQYCCFLVKTKSNKKPK
jgi:hypothetical protein